MPFVSILLIVTAGILFLAFVLVIIALFSPVILVLDSKNWQLRVRYLAALEFWMALPGGGGERGISIARMPIHLPQRSAVRASEKASKRTEGKVASRRSESEVRRRQEVRARLRRFVRGCLVESSIRGPLVSDLRQFWRGLMCSIWLPRRDIILSLPDPAWNGMLAGWLAARGDGNGFAVRVNFMGENSFFLEARLYPYRLAKASLEFLLRLPLRALFREWQASSAAASG